MKIEPTRLLIDRSIHQLNVRERYPMMIILDITNVCNFECPHCPQPLMAARPDYRASYLSYEAYAQIIDEIADKGVKFIRFTGEGEPMLHKRLLDMIRYAKQKTSSALVLTTNASVLNEEWIHNLLDLQMDVIDISLDAFTKEKYNVVRKGGNYHEVMSNVHRLLAMRENNKSKTRIMVNMIRQILVNDEVNNFQKFWTPLVDFVLIRNLHSATKQVNREEVAMQLATQGQERHPCAHLWKRLTIDAHLNVKFCAHDWNSETVLSKLGPGGIRDIWFSKRMQEIRKAHEVGQYQKVPVCSDCPDWAAAPWDYGYEKILEKIGVIQLD